MKATCTRPTVLRILSATVILLLAFLPLAATSAQENTPPQGYHDGNSGDVRSWACNAGGWAMDPDGPDQDVLVRIRVDGDPDPVLEVWAENYREDLEGACPGGTCAFETSLWDSITHNEPHEIIVEAQDLQSGQWYPLNATPKSLTCWGYPEGFHDYDSGDVPSYACNAGGWAMDPDSPDQDVTVRILVDGEAVLEVLADTYREDLVAACPGGTCAFEASLWNSLTPYEAHEITAQAWDPETDAWYSLNATPKTLTCRTYDIYTYDTLTGETGQITALADSHEYNPRWSPDGKRIVHDRWSLDWSENLGVHITDVKTGASAPLAGAENGNYPTWSPNGKWIAFNDGEQLHIVPPEGSEPTLVRDDAFMASWAPNSKRLAFHQPSDGSIRTVDLNGENATLVVEGGNGPAWSPNGQWIAYEMDGDLWKVRVDRQGNLLGAPIQLTSDPAWEGRPSWSADSKTIAFHAGYNDEDTDIWTIPADGGTATRLTGGPDFDDYDPNYSNNGRYVAYSGYMPLYPPPLGLRVNYGHDWVESFYAAGHKVWLKVTESDGKTVKATATLVTEPKDFWGGETGFQTQPEDWDPSPPDIQPYDWVFGRVDNGVSAQVQIGDISGTIDLVVDSIAGTVTAPWYPQDVEVEVGCHPWGAPEPQPEMKYDSVLPDGMDAYSCSWAGEWDIQYYQDVGVGYSGPDGHWVANAFFVRNPHFTIFPEWEWFDGMEWPDGASVSINVAGKPECSTSAESWGYFFNGGFPEGCDVAPGDVVTFDDGTTIRQHTVQNLAITGVDKMENTVAGTADPGALVHVWVHEIGGDLQPTAGEDGNWLADFDDSGVDLVENMGGRAQIYDEVGNGTAVDWYLPNPHFTIFPEWEWFDGMDWPDGATVGITVEGKDECTTAGVSEGYFFNGGFPEGCDVAPGDVVTFADGTTTREHTVRNLAITGVDKGENTVAGTADPGALVHVWVHEIGGDLQPTAGEDGIWLADFDDSGVDLVENMGGRAQIYDEAGNGTAVDWYIPNPRFTIFPEGEWFDGMDWPDGATVSISVEGKPECFLEKESWGYFFNGGFPEGCDVVVGDVVTFDDGMTTREHTVRNLAITMVDAEANVVAGTADAYAEVYVWPHATGEQVLAAADDAGAWLVDFTGAFDLVPGECGRAEIRDGVGNSTAVDWCVP